MSFSRNQIILFGLIVHALTAFFSVGYHQCDELFQVYEFAGYKLGINKAEELPWEFASQMRSGIQPMIVYVVTRAFHFLSVCNPFTISFFIRLCTSMCSFIGTVMLLRILEKEIKIQGLKIWLWAFGLLFWCLPYFHARFSSENFSATLFLFGLIAVLNAFSSERQHLHFLPAGVLLGLSFMCRFQMLFMITGLLAWLIFMKRVRPALMLTLVSGMAIGIVFGVLTDRWLYGQWLFSPWNYLDLNLFQNKASQFGREPFYYYLGEGLLQLIPPFSVFIMACAVLFWLRCKRHVITWITLPFIFLHFFVAHKELRFLFPVLNFLPFMVLYSLQSSLERPRGMLTILNKKSVVGFAVIVNTLALFYFMFKPADNTSYQLKKIYSVVQGKKPVLLYENTDPYNNAASLNYFRNPAISTMSLKNVMRIDSLKNDSVFYLSEKLNEGDRITKNGVSFVKVYSEYPSWFYYLDFNGWLERSGTFSLYKLENDL